MHDRPSTEERRASGVVQVDLDAGRWAKAIQDLDEWQERFPHSQLAALRAYEYMQAHSALAHPDRVVEYGAALMASAHDDLNEQQIASILYLTMVNAAALRKPSKDQRALGLAAAQSLLDSLPRYFQDGRRPGDTTSEQWAASRRQLEAAAKDAVKTLSVRAGA